MNDLTPSAPLDLAFIERQVVARDREIANAFSKDLQVVALRGARRYRGDRLIRVAPPHRLLDPAAGPLIAVRLRVLDPQDARRARDRPVGPRAAGRRRRVARGSVRRR